MSSILDIQIEKPRHVKVEVLDIKLKKISIDGKIHHKANFITEEIDTGNQFQMSDAWVIESNATKVVRALWIDPEWSHIKKRCTVGRLLDYYQKDSLRGFLGEEISAFPDRNYYLAIEGCPVDKQDLERELNKDDLY